ncbi:uncharacterized protein A4U43_C06F14160 [Asparagus officinalis]|uniref:Uncharacterized protein n=1 Tax=Asparagus officinalis TaxID=4686 RepID=A0A5P1EMF4_ASPOF|nr:uncharacterized protein A4U43_C06F14160 [Asparagus officinalis]
MYTGKKPSPIKPSSNSISDPILPYLQSISSELGKFERNPDGPDQKLKALLEDCVQRYFQVSGTNANEAFFSLMNEIRKVHDSVHVKPKGPPKEKRQQSLGGEIVKAKRKKVF